MSLADTAALVSSLELKDKFTPTVNKYEKALTGLERSTNNLHKTSFAVGQDIGSGINKTVKNLEKIGLIAGGFLISQVKFGIDALKQLDDVTTQTNAVIRSTRGAAGESAKAIRDLALKYEDLNATIDDKVIQSGENILLTFTNIGKKAFEPALQAALNLNQALGGGESGLQGTMIQLGKALNDPVKGLTSLRRVGVSFTADQEKQIKTLVKHNDLYGAQKIILAELTKEFGGSFAAAGQTATGKFASLADAIDDAQQSLATAFLPTLTEVAGTLATFLRDPATIAAIKNFGRELAGGFKAAFDWVRKLDFASIGNALKTAAGFAGTLIGKFMDAPDWLKTAVITGWGLNKISGGALTNIGGDILKGIGGEFFSRGSPLNPMFVKDVGGIGGALGGLAGGAGEVAAGGGIAAGILTVGLSAGTLAALGVAFVSAMQQAPDVVPGNRGGTQGQVFSPSHGFGPRGQRQRFDTGGNALSPDERQAVNDLTRAQMSAFADQVTGDFGRIDKTAVAFDRGLQALSAASLKAAGAIERDWLKRIDASDIAARSKAKTGHAPTPAEVAAIRSRDLLHNVDTILHRSAADSRTKLERLRVLAADARAHGDTVTARKIQAAIDRMKAGVISAANGTTSAVNALKSGIQAVGQAKVAVTVNTTVSVSDVKKTTVKQSRYYDSNP